MLACLCIITVWNYYALSTHTCGRNPFNENFDLLVFSCQLLCSPVCLTINGQAALGQMDHLGKEDDAMTIYRTILKGREEVASGTMAFHFEKPEGFAYKAGNGLTSP